MNKFNDINRCLTCILGKNSILWHYNEIPDKLRFKERLLVRYIGGFRTLIYEFAYCKSIYDISTFKYYNNNQKEFNKYVNSLNDTEKYFICLENNNKIEIPIKNIHSWCYAIDLITLIDDKK